MSAAGTGPGINEDLATLYRVRFSSEERAARDRLWKVLCSDFFQSLVPADATVLDLACGLGEFTRNIQAARKVAVDLNADARHLLPETVEFHETSATDLSPIAERSIDLCFTSNFFEHLPDKDAMDRVLRGVLRVLKPGGRFVALQPNIRYAGERYWDFYDHVLPLSHLSAREGFEKNGYEVVRLIPRFLPFSTKSALPQHPALVRLYLHVPLAWRLLGKQFLIVGRKPVDAA